MSTRIPSIAMEQQKRIVELTEAWNRCKADNSRLEKALLAVQNEREEVAQRLARQEKQGIADMVSLMTLLREVLEHNTPPLELRERISAMVSPSGCKQEKPKATVGETNVETNQAT